MKLSKADILVGLAVLGVPATAALTARAAVKNDRMRPATDYKAYILPAAVGVGTIACMVAARVIDIKSEHALYAALGIANKMIDKYDEAISERYSPEEARELRKSVIQEIAIDDIHQPYQDDDRFWCYEPYTKTFFSASQVELLAAEIELNQRFSECQCVWLDEWIDILDIRHPKELEPYTRGWFVDDTFCWNSSFFGYYIGLYSEAGVVDGQECLIIALNMDPYEPDEPDEWCKGGYEAIPFPQ